MKKLLFLLLIWLYPIFSFGTINECLTDVYFANGILTDEGNATTNTDLLKIAILVEQYGGDESKMQKQIGKVATAYNSTHGLFPDGLETLRESHQRRYDIMVLCHFYLRSQENPSPKF